MTPNTWTIEQKLQALMRLPWSICVERDSVDGLLVAQVEEVPDAIATGATDAELARDLWHSLYDSLSVRLEHNDPLELPAGETLPWSAARAPGAPRLAIRFIGSPPAATSAAVGSFFNLVPAT
jgi:hypothetical protein